MVKLFHHRTNETTDTLTANLQLDMACLLIKKKTQHGTIISGTTIVRFNEYSFSEKSFRFQLSVFLCLLNQQMCPNTFHFNANRHIENCII
jgi:hypothetical protein